MAFAASAAIAEAGLLSVLAPAARALAPQITALPPLAVFHDLRWLYSAQRSWLGFAALLAGLVLARSAVIALLVRLAWPDKATVPAPLAALRCAVAFTVFASLLMSPVVSLTLGVAILPFSWPFLASLPVMLLIALPLSHGGVVSTWWRMLPPPSAVGWMLADFVVLSVAAAAIGRLPMAGTMPVAGLAGLFNARAWYGLTAVVVQARHRPPVHAHTHWYDWRASAWQTRRIPVAPLATVAAIVVVTLVTRLAFLASVPADRALAKAQDDGTADSGKTVQPGQLLPPGVSGGSRSGQPPVLEVPGFGSHCCVHGRALARAMPGTLVQQFSYRGLDPAGNPLPYGPAASNLPLPVLGDRVAAQAWRLHPPARRPGHVGAESEGAPRVYSPVSRDSAARRPARVPGGELQAVVWFVGGLSPFGASGAQKLIASVNSVGARFAAAAARHKRFRWLELVPLADAVTLPACRLPSNVLVVPAMHGELLGDPAALRMIRNFLTHRPVRATAGLRGTAELVAAAATAWRIPQATVPSPPCAR